MVLDEVLRTCIARVNCSRLFDLLRYLSLSTAVLDFLYFILEISVFIHTCAACSELPYGMVYLCTMVSGSAIEWDCWKQGRVPIPRVILNKVSHGHVLLRALKKIESLSNWLLYIITPTNYFKHLLAVQKISLYFFLL